MFLASPLGWFHGGVALVYIVEMFFSVLVGLLCWRNAETRGSAAFSSAIALGLAAGVRQSSLVLL
jgi:predicted membrane-bound dolichyl-phosphate-mannose-protein mannosyltransferase